MFIWELTTIFLCKKDDGTDVEPRCYARLDMHTGEGSMSRSGGKAYLWSQELIFSRDTAKPAHPSNLVADFFDNTFEKSQKKRVEQSSSSFPSNVWWPSPSKSPRTVPRNLTWAHHEALLCDSPSLAGYGVKKKRVIIGIWQRLKTGSTSKLVEFKIQPKAFQLNSFQSESRAHCFPN